MLSEGLFHADCCLFDFCESMRPTQAHVRCACLMFVARHPNLAPDVLMAMVDDERVCSAVCRSQLNEMFVSAV